MQWKALPKDVKDRYEERARVIAASTKKISEMPESVVHGTDSRSMSPHSNSYLPGSGTSIDAFTYLAARCSHRRT